MQNTYKHLKALARAVVLIWAGALCAMATASEVVSFDYVDAQGHTAQVEAEVDAPEQTKGAPAVVLLHHAGGWRMGTTRQYAEALTAQGYVTIAPRMFDLRQMRNSLDHLGQAFGALRYAVDEMGVDPQRVSVLGLSYGSWLAIYASTEWAKQRYNEGRFGFVKAAPLYPVCWTLLASMQGRLPPKLSNPLLPGDLFELWSAKQVRFFVAGQDDYDDNDASTCEQFVSALPESVDRHMFSYKVYPKATHAWDQSRNQDWYERIACKGKGCKVYARSDRAVTQQGIEDLLAFLSE